MTLPDGVDPAKVPTRERLDALTEHELFAIIHYQQDKNYVIVGTDFWISELSRRRTQLILDQIAAAGAVQAQHAAEMVRLTAEAAAENAKTASLHREIPYRSLPPLRKSA